MASGMKNQAKVEEIRIEMKRGIADQFLKQRRLLSKLKDNDKQSDVLFEEMIETLLKLITKQLPISDDILLICWKYEMLINPNEKNNRLWKVLNNVILNVLNNSRNKRNWIWFKSYILNSIVEFYMFLFFFLFGVCVSCFDSC